MAPGNQAYLYRPEDHHRPEDSTFNPPTESFSPTQGPSEAYSFAPGEGTLYSEGLTTTATPYPYYPQPVVPMPFSMELQYQYQLQLQYQHQFQHPHQYPPPYPHQHQRQHPFPTQHQPQIQHQLQPQHYQQPQQSQQLLHHKHQLELQLQLEQQAALQSRVQTQLIPQPKPQRFLSQESILTGSARSLLQGDLGHTHKRSQTLPLEAGHLRKRSAYATPIPTATEPDKTTASLPSAGFTPHHRTQKTNTSISTHLGRIHFERGETAPVGQEHQDTKESPAVRPFHHSHSASSSLSLQFDGSQDILLEAQQSVADCVTIPQLADRLNITAPRILQHQTAVRQKDRASNKMVNRNLKALKETVDRNRIVFSVRCLHDVAHLLEVPLASEAVGFAMGETATPRSLVFKAYDLVCYQNDVKPLGVSALGKLIKLLWPSITTKRLGVRGNSKYHYMGIALSDWVLPLCNQYDDKAYEEEYFQRHLKGGAEDHPSSQLGVLPPTAALVATAPPRPSPSIPPQPLTLARAAPSAFPTESKQTPLICPALASISIPTLAPPPTAAVDLDTLSDSPYLSFIKGDLQFSTLIGPDNRLLTKALGRISPILRFGKPIDVQAIPFREAFIPYDSATAGAEACRKAIRILVEASKSYYEVGDFKTVNLIDMACYREVLVFCAPLAYCQEALPVAPSTSQLSALPESVSMSAFSSITQHYFQLFKAFLLEASPATGSTAAHRHRLTNAYKFVTCMNHIHKGHHLATGLVKSLLVRPEAQPQLARAWNESLAGKSTDSLASLFPSLDDITYSLSRNQPSLLSLRYEVPKTDTTEGLSATVEYIITHLIPRVFHTSALRPFRPEPPHVFSHTSLDAHSYTLRLASFIDSLPALCEAEPETESFTLNVAHLLFQHLCDVAFQRVVLVELIRSDVLVLHWWQLKCWVEYFVKIVFELHGLGQEIDRLRSKKETT